MNIRTRALIAMGAVALAASFGTAATAQSACKDGTPSNDTYTCGGAPIGGDVDLDLGSDTFTLYASGRAVNIQGDGVASNVDPATNPPWVADPMASAPGGTDKITIYGQVSNTVAGDYLDQANGGNDTITLNRNSYVLMVAGDLIFAPPDVHTGDGGADVLRINGTARTVQGDNVPGNGGADTITVDRDGVVEVGVIGDVAQLNGGNDTINIFGSVTGVTNEEGFFPGFVAGDQANGQGGRDRIVVNGTVNGSVYGDMWVTNGGNDTITIRGTVTETVEGDYQGTKGGDDTITIYGSVGGMVAGDTSVNGGNDRIIIGGSVGGDVLGDNLYSASGVGGNDTITLQGNAHVAGVINGEGGRDVLVFKLTGDASGDAQIAAAVAAQSPSGSITYNGRTYRWQNFEEIRQVASTAQIGSGTLAALSFDWLFGAIVWNRDLLG